MAPGADPTTAVVQWATADASRPRVRWSTSPLTVAATTKATTATAGPSSKSSSSNNGGGSGSGNSSVFVVEGETSTYSRDQMCGGSAKSAGWFEPGSLHRATLRGLPAASRVFYEVFDAAADEEATTAAAAAGKKGGDGNDAAAVRRSGSFFTPAMPREEGQHEEARLVLMADAGEFSRAFFLFSSFLVGGRERERKRGKKKVTNE